MSDSSDFGAFMTGLIIGGLVGAGASLLMAPQSGEETRELLRDRGIELRDRADEEVRELRKRAEDTLSDMREQVEELQVQAKQTIDDARAKLEKASNSNGGTVEETGEA